MMISFIFILAWIWATFFPFRPLVGRRIDDQLFRPIGILIAFRHKDEPKGYFIERLDVHTLKDIVL